MIQPNCFLFGKYRNIPFAKVPLQYLQWQLKRNSGLWKEVRVAAQAELDRRLSPPKEIQLAPQKEIKASQCSYEQMREELEELLKSRGGQQ